MPSIKLTNTLFLIALGAVTVARGASFQTASPLDLASALAGSASITIDAAVDESWNLETTASWVQTSPSAGTGPATVALSVSGNPTVDARSAWLGLGDDTLQVNQPGGDHAIDRDTIPLNKRGTATVLALSAAPTAPWTSENSTDWIMVSPASGTGPAEIEISALGNSGDNPRSAMIRIAGIPIEVEQNGRIVFSVRLPFAENLGEGAAFSGGVVCDDAGTVYVGNQYYNPDPNFSYTPEIIAFDSQSGALQWRSDGRLPSYNQTVYLDGKLYTTGGIGDGDPLIKCYSASDGALLWSLPKPDYGLWSQERTYGRAIAADAQGGIYVVSNVDSVADPAHDRGVAVNRIDAPGHIDWTRSFSGESQFEHVTRPVITLNGHIVIATSRAVRALDLATGSDVWIYTLEEGNSVSSAPLAAEDGRIYFGDDAGYVYAVRGDDGTELFKNKSLDYPNAPTPMTGSAVIDTNGNIISTGSNLSCVIDGGTGAVIQFLAAGFGDPVIGSDGNLYLCDPNSNAFRAVRTDNRDLGRIEYHGEEVLWSIDLGEVKLENDGAMDDHGVYYTVSGDGILYAIDTGCDGLADTAWPAEGGNAANHHRQRQVSTGGAPVHAGDPQTLLLEVDGRGYFFPEIEGAKPIRYRWLKDRSDLADSDCYQWTDLKNLEVTACDDSVAGTYTLEAQNAFGTQTFAAFEVVLAPAIATSPLGEIDRVEGETLTLAVSATGSAATYQWFHDNSLLADDGRVSGATTATLSIANLGPDDAGGYRVELTNAAGSTASTFATLTMHPALAIALDNDELTYAQTGEAAWIGMYGPAPAPDDYATVPATVQIGEEANLACDIRGPALVSFSWLFDAANSSDSLRLYLDGEILPMREAVSASDWTRVTVSIPTGTHTLRWRYERIGGSLASIGLDALSVSDPGENVFQALDYPAGTFAQSGEGIWLRELDPTRVGQDLLQSAPLGESEQVKLTLSITGPAEVAFAWKLQNADTGNWATFSLDGVPLETLSDPTDWTIVSQAIGSGEHELSWSYRKFYGSPGETTDHLALDDLQVTAANFTDPGPVLGWTADAWSVSGSRLWTAATATDGPWQDEALTLPALAPGEDGTLELTVTGPGMLAFFHRCELDPTWDRWSFSVDDVEVHDRVGAYHWAEDFLWIPSGQHTVSFSAGRSDYSSTGLAGRVELQHLRFFSGSLAPGWLDAYRPEALALESTLTTEGATLAYSREIAHLGHRAVAAATIDLENFIDLIPGQHIWVERIEPVSSTTERVVLRLHPDFTVYYSELYLQLQPRLVAPQ